MQFHFNIKRKKNVIAEIKKKIKIFNRLFSRDGKLLKHKALEQRLLSH